MIEAQCGLTIVHSQPGRQSRAVPSVAALNRVNASLH